MGLPLFITPPNDEITPRPYIQMRRKAEEEAAQNEEAQRVIRRRLNRDAPSRMEELRRQGTDGPQRQSEPTDARDIAVAHVLDDIRVFQGRSHNHRVRVARAAADAAGDDTQDENTPASPPRLPNTITITHTTTSETSPRISFAELYDSIRSPRLRRVLIGRTRPGSSRGLGLGEETAIAGYEHRIAGRVGLSNRATTLIMRLPITEARTLLRRMWDEHTLSGVRPVPNPPFTAEELDSRFLVYLNTLHPDRQYVREDGTLRRLPLYEGRTRFHARSRALQERYERLDMQLPEYAERIPSDAAAMGGLGDRNRSPSPDNDSGWDTLFSTIPPDPQPPSLESSFTSTAASSAASQALSNTSSASGASTAPTSNSSSVPPSSSTPARLPLPYAGPRRQRPFQRPAFPSHRPPNALPDRAFDMADLPSSDACEYAEANLARDSDEEEDIYELNNYEASLATVHASAAGRVEGMSPAEMAEARRERELFWEGYADVVVRRAARVWSVAEERESSGLELDGMQRIVGRLARREDIPEGWWGAVGLRRVMEREVRAEIAATEGVTEETAAL